MHSDDRPESPAEDVEEVAQPESPAEDVEEVALRPSRDAAPPEPPAEDVEEVALRPSRDAAPPDWRTALREKGYRLTPQRELILGAVDALGHATPDEVLAHVQQTASTVNASTVYRTLEVLEELGLVRHAHLSDRAPTYHSTRDEEHFHLVCRGCHAVTSVPAAEADALVGTLQARGFTADLSHLTVFGRCADCEGES